MDGEGCVCVRAGACFFPREMSCWLPHLGPLPEKRPPRALRTRSEPPQTRRYTLTGTAFDAPLGSRHGEDREAVVILGAARLDGAYVAVAASSEHARQIQRLDGLRFHLPEHGLAHGLELTVECISQLHDGQKDEIGVSTAKICTNEQRFTWVLVRERV